MPPSTPRRVRQDQLQKQASQDTRAERAGEPRAKLNPFDLDRLFALEREQIWT
jgi:hypothetical protein